MDRNESRTRAAANCADGRDHRAAAEAGVHDGHEWRVLHQTLELGAVDFVAKPTIDIAHSFADYAEEIIAKVKVASRAHVREAQTVGQRRSADAVLPTMKASRLRTGDSIIALGASTGGTEAIREILEVMPPDSPAMVIAQHIPEAFSTAFAQRMNRCTQMIVSEARHGEQILPGHVYIAPGNRHLLVECDGSRYRCKLSGEAPVNRHRPSVDVLFRSVARSAGANAVGVILTGMGDDGAAGLQEMKEAGACTIAQNEKTSVVWGMPGEAVARGCVDDVVSLSGVARKIHEALESRSSIPV